MQSLRTVPRPLKPPHLVPRQPKTVLGWSMQKLRHVNGWTGKQVAEAFGCSPAHISRVEQGSKPSRELVQFYEDDSFLLEALSRLVGDSLTSGDSAVVIATKAHRDGLADGKSVFIKFNNADHGCGWNVKVKWTGYSEEVLFKDLDLCTISKATLKYDRGTKKTTAFVQ